MARRRVFNPGPTQVGRSLLLRLPLTPVVASDRVADQEAIGKSAAPGPEPTSKLVGAFASLHPRSGISLTGADAADDETAR